MTLSSRLQSMKPSKFEIELPRQQSSIAPDDVYTNIDTDPTLKSQRLWGPGTVLLYWFSDIVGVAGWQTASSFISAGLDWRQALGIQALGACLLSIPLVLNGRIGAILHVPFPILIRASHGYWFAYFPVVSRAVIAVLWFGVVSWNGGACIQVMLKAIWPSFANLKNTAPADAGYTTISMISFLIYWLLQFPFVFIHPSKLKILLSAKAIVVPIVAVATLVWTLKKGGGTSALINQHTTLTGSALTSKWLLALASTIGGYSTLALNIPDFTRYTNSPNVCLIQAPALPVLYLLGSVFGTLAASASLQFSPTIIWSPLALASLWLDNPGGRAAAFFAASAWMLGNISTNISSNSISAANDLSTLFPRYINIRRGQILTCIVGAWCMVPWKILASGAVFLNFISGYAFILGPFAGIMITDYYIVKKGAYDVPGLYDPRGAYHYNHGVNWRAVVTLLCSIGPTFPGFVKVLAPTIVIGNIQWLYSVAWIYGIISSSIIFTLLNLAFPDKTGSIIDHVIYATDSEKFRAWEASQGIDGSAGSDDGVKEGMRTPDEKEFDGVHSVLPVVGK